ncbi:MAG: hypothetical protein WD673_06840 [Alphaproteobacteria bacterium]
MPGPVGTSLRRRAIVVHGRDDVAVVARLSLELEIPVTLLTAPGAADYAGPDVLLAMVRHGLAEAPESDVEAVIDCADAAGRALAALRAGWTRVLFTGSAETAARLADIAQQCGATLLTERPEARDAGGDAIDAVRLRNWLYAVTA